MRNPALRAAAVLFATTIPFFGAEATLDVTNPDPQAAGMNGKHL